MRDILSEHWVVTPGCIERINQGIVIHVASLFDFIAEERLLSGFNNGVERGIPGFHETHVVRRLCAYTQ